MRADELIKKIKVSRSTLGHWKNKGLPFHAVEKTVLYDPDEVIKWIKAYKNKK